MQTLYTYSLIRSLYDEGRDYLDAFWPFILLVLPTDKTALSMEKIQDSIREKYGLDIPDHSLVTLVTRAKRRKYVIRKQKACALTERGIDYVKRFEPEIEVRRRINELKNDLVYYLKAKHSLQIDPSKAMNLLSVFIERNIEFFRQLFEPKAKGTEIYSGLANKKYEQALIAYIIEVENAKPSIYKTLEHLIVGSIMSIILRQRSFPETTQKFKRTRLYLDTNLVFSILGLRYDEFSRPAQQMLKLIKSNGAFELFVFDFTLDETVHHLSRYKDESKKYFTWIKVDSIYSTLKARGYGAAEIRLLIANIDKKVLDHGINIEHTGVRLNEYEVDPMRIEGLEAYKPWQGRLGQKHDLLAIELVQKRRVDVPRHFETAKAFFLTADLRLSRFNLKEDGHSRNQTICEVIPDRFLTNMLWLKNPSLLRNVELSTIISIYGGGDIIDSQVWRRFHGTVVELKKTGRVTEDDISVLLYDGCIGDALKKVDASISEEELSDMITCNIDDAKKRLDNEKKLAIEQLKIEYEAEKAELAKVLNQRVMDAIEEEKERVRVAAKKGGRIAYLIIRIVICAIACGVVILISPLVVRKWETIEPYVWVIQLAVFVMCVLGGFKFDPWLLHGVIKDKINGIVYKMMIRASHIEDVASKLSKDALNNN